MTRTPVTRPDWDWRTLRTQLRDLQATVDALEVIVGGTTNTAVTVTPTIAVTSTAAVSTTAALTVAPTLASAGVKP
jgi:carbohydrate-binding DOMON domain-containing protein